MTAKEHTNRSRQTTWQELLDIAMKQPGVATTVELYERAERVLINVSLPPTQIESTSSSADSQIESQSQYRETVEEEDEHTSEPQERRVRELRLEARHYELLAVQVPSNAGQYHEIAAHFDKSADELDGTVRVPITFEEGS